MSTHPAMNSITSTSGTGGLIGAYQQSIYPTTEDLRPTRDKVMFKVETVENGYVLCTGYEGLYGKTYICATPQELADRIIASMVTNKLEK